MVFSFYGPAEYRGMSRVELEFGFNVGLVPRVPRAKVDGKVGNADVVSDLAGVPAGGNLQDGPDDAHDVRFLQSLAARFELFVCQQLLHALVRKRSR
jgi:hypothetical protein